MRESERERERKCVWSLTERGIVCLLLREKRDKKRRGKERKIIPEKVQQEKGKVAGQ